MIYFIRTFDFPHIGNGTEHVTAACTVNVDAVLTELVMRARLRPDQQAQAFDGRIAVKIIGSETGTK